MKKNIIIMLIVVITLTAVVTTVYAIHNDVSIPDIFTTGTTSVPNAFEESTNEVVEPVNNVPGDTDAEQVEPTDTKHNENESVDTTVPPETESVETPPAVVEPIEVESKTYICTADMYTRDGFLTSPEYIPALTLNGDGTLIFRVYYFGGVTDVPGTYEIENNHIYIDCVLEGTPVYGFYADGMAWMDNKFMFEIVGEDTLIFYGHPDDTGDVRCYTVKPGDAFVHGDV